MSSLQKPSTVNRSGEHVDPPSTAQEGQPRRPKFGRDLSGVKLCSVDGMPLRQIAQTLNSRVAQVRARKDREVEKSKATLANIPDWLLGSAMRAVGYLTYDLGLDLSRFGVAYDQFG